MASKYGQIQDWNRSRDGLIQHWWWRFTKTVKTQQNNPVIPDFTLYMRITFKRCTAWCIVFLCSIRNSCHRAFWGLVFLGDEGNKWMRYCCCQYLRLRLEPRHKMKQTMQENITQAENEGVGGRWLTGRGSRASTHTESCQNLPTTLAIWSFWRSSYTFKCDN